MKKTVNFCGNCPFFWSEYDDFAVGDSTINFCTLSKYLKNEEYILSTSNNMETEHSLSPVDWCPLRYDNFNFSFKEFSEKRKNEINSVGDLLSRLYDEDNNYTDEYSEEEYDKRSLEISELNVKLAELMENEESDDDESFLSEEEVSEIYGNIDEIKEQISSLEEAGTKLQEMLDNFTKYEN